MLAVFCWQLWCWQWAGVLHRLPCWYASHSLQRVHGRQSRPWASRCSECDGGFYRFGGLCRPCPRNRLLFFVLCAMALVGVLAATHAVLKFGVNLAPLTIAVDYFQVLWLSNFGRMLTIMFSLVDLNVEAAAPECFVGVSFTRDWAGQWWPCCRACALGCWCCITGAGGRCGDACTRSAAHRWRCKGIRTIALAKCCCCCR